MLEEGLSVPYIPSQNQALIDWKSKGKKAIGYFCQSFPKEMIYAAGILPIRILGDSKPIERGDDFFSRFACYLARSAVDLPLKGELDLLDGTVFTYSCDVMHYLAPRWQQLPSEEDKFWYYLTRPTKSNTEGAEEFFRIELNDLKKEIEKHFQVSITDDALRKAIDVYNEKRALLREVASLKKNGLISSVEEAKVNFGSMVSPPEANNEFLKSFIAKVKEERQPQRDGRVKVFVSGATLPNTELFELIEEEGGVVIEDDLCVGCRYSRGTIPADQDLLIALAKHYLAEEELNYQCPSMLTEGRHDARLKHIEDSVADYGIKGVIFAIPYNCDKHYWDVVWFTHDLREKGIPTLTLSAEGYMKSEAVRTRIAAFIETIG